MNCALMNTMRRKLGLVLLWVGLTHNTVSGRVTNVRPRVKAKQ